VITERYRAKLSASAKRRLRTPNVPPHGEVLATLHDEFTGDWVLYLRRNYSTERFYTCKLIATQARPGKANYNFGVERATGRITNQVDAWHMRHLMPSVYAWCQVQAKLLCGV